MQTSGIAMYNSDSNTLEVIRPGEGITRYIPCTNLNLSVHKVHGVQVNGDEILVLVGPHGNSRPDRKIIYRFSSLSGGGSNSL